ncbi:hypothetical protein Scep_019809 [Stephania cephalantha]|uniref:Uncharacterized protein n=1 Tax=Stephania cephalantha TaxID=152367 RepID=A0AAP0IBV4_9MAGN
MGLEDGRICKMASMRVIRSRRPSLISAFELPAWRSNRSGGSLKPAINAALKTQRSFVALLQSIARQSVRTKFLQQRRDIRLGICDVKYNVFMNQTKIIEQCRSLPPDIFELFFMMSGTILLEDMARRNEGRCWSCWTLHHFEDKWPLRELCPKCPVGYLAKRRVKNEGLKKDQPSSGKVCGFFNWDDYARRRPTMPTRPNTRESNCQWEQGSN